MRRIRVLGQEDDMRLAPSWGEVKLRWAWVLPVVAVVSLIYVTHRAIGWAMAPGYWCGSWLQSGDETALELAHKGFGPILLQTHWICDPPGTWGTKDDAIQAWGYYETACRLQLIIWTAVAVLSAALTATIWRRAPTTARTVPLTRSGSTSG